MTILSYLATIFGSLMALSNLPQAYKIYKRKSAGDISIITCLILLIGAIIWVLYGTEIKNPPIIIANSIGVIGILLVITGWFLYGRNKK
jgi:MtN3 and saliva related transmembrane protein